MDRHVIEEIVAERRRQINAKGYTQEHDDEHANGEIALAAALYAIPYHNPKIKQDDYIGLQMALEIGTGWNLKPDTYLRRRLIKAAALIVAEIERLDRADPQGRSVQSLAADPGRSVPHHGSGPDNI